jgi:hypothetical protein
MTVPRAATLGTVEIEIQPTRRNPKMFNISMPQRPSIRTGVQYHHWQGLACLIQDHRPDWAVEDILAKLLLCEDLQTYPDLAGTALLVAMNPDSATPAAIHFAAASMTRTGAVGIR